MEPGGRLITIEGIEGAGKSTQLRRLADWLRRPGRRVETTCEPDGAALGVEVRRLLGERPALDPLAECFLFMAARAQHVRRVVRPWLDAGAVVVCDRFTDSTVAYQGYGRGVPLEVVTGLNRIATDGLVPLLTVVLDLDVADGLARVHGRGTAVDPFEALGLEFHERVRKGYRAIHEREPDRVVLVDGSGPPDAVAAAVRHAVAARLGVGAAEP
ncbi:MAG: dTMP kinase [Candidatus Rokuibacteriota bacterium]